MYDNPYFYNGNRQQPISPLTPSGAFPPFFPGQFPIYPGQGGYPAFPPYQPPGQGGYAPPPPPIFPDQGAGTQQGPPQSPPPAYIPQKPQFMTYAVDPGGIRRCLYRYTYIWLQNGRGFWFYPIFVGRTSVAGYRWRQNQFRWVYVGIDLNQIDYFECT